MCGRYAVTTAVIGFLDDCGAGAPPPEMPLADRYNIAPTQPVMIVREDRDTGSGKREMAHVIWGLIPTWSDSPAIGSRLINARSETVAEKPAFRNALKRRRCLIPASGFYEWRQAPNGELDRAATAAVDEGDLFSGQSGYRSPGGILRTSGGGVSPAAAGPGSRGARKTPYYFQLKDERTMALAGLWEIWNGPNGEVLESCTILTTRANDLVAGFHDRMPVILPPELFDLWLNPEVQDAREVTPLFKSFPADGMKVHEVSLLVNSPRNDGPELIRPVNRSV